MVRLAAVLAARHYKPSPGAVKAIKFATVKDVKEPAQTDKNLNAPKLKESPTIKKKILDSIVLNVKGGAGGCGNSKLRGKGGKGGDVYFIATKGETLPGLKKRLPYVQIHAESGGDATNLNHCLGKAGVDKWIPVPVGVNIYDNIGNYLGSLSKENNALLVAKGGQGGSVRNKFNFGGGQAVSTKVELQVVADVGIFGFEGVGKTSLMHHLTLPLSRMPPLAESTKYAEVKKMVYPDLREMSVLDTPSFWPDMKEDKRGQKILSYLKRSRLLIICLDATGSNRKLNLFESYMRLNKEIEVFNAKMLSKPTIVVVNKFDHPDSQFGEFQEQLNNPSDFAGMLRSDIRPSKFFQPKHLVGMDLKVKEEDKLKVLWQQIRDFIDQYEFERIERETEGERFFRMHNT